MRTTFRGIAGLTVALSGAIGFLGGVPSSKAAQLKEAQVTQIVKDVQLLSAQATARPAVVRDNVREGTAVRTGEESRTELTFTDQTLARLGANTLFNFQGGTRNLDLGGGAILLSVPRDAHSATVRTAAVTAAISGGTAALEHHGNAYCKFICLEGTVRVSLKGTRESVLLRPGQMLVTPPNPSRLTEPVEIDLERFVNTCVLITDFPPLGNQPLIAEAIAQQQHEKAEGKLVASNQVVLEHGDLITLVDPTALDTIDQKTNAVGGVGIGFQPIKFGPLPTIIAPVPYVINAGTLIQTDPFIQTNGATDFGRIYRGNAADGVPSDYFFGGASAFDVTINFNTLSEVPANLPIAAFKFTSLQLAGNPTISLGTGGATSLVLISEGGITSGGAGGTLTFPNLSLVLFATQNGSITLGNTIAFANMLDLRFYARGAGSNLTLASPMMNMGSVSLIAEGSVQVNADEGVQFFNSFAGVDFLTGTGLIAASGGINIQAIGNVNFSMAQFEIGAGASVILGGFSTTNVAIDASVNPSLFANAASVTVTATNTINITGGTTMTFGNLTNASFTTLTGGISAPTESFFHPGGLLSMSSAGDLNAQSILGGNLIGANGNINVTGDVSARVVASGGEITVGGNLTTTQLTQALVAPGTITVTGTLTSPDVEATGNVTAGHVVVLNLNVTGSFFPYNTILTAGAGGITPFGTLNPPAQHLFNVITVQSHTASTGLNFSGNNYLTTGASGGLLTINADHQTFSAADGINGANFNGADSTNAAVAAGDGGTLEVNSLGTLDLIGTNITATSGIMADNTANQNTLGGNGGNVTLAPAAALTIQNSVVQVSSADSPGVANRRSSARGGNITLSSPASNGTAISIDNSSQLLSLLESTTTGPGGLIAISANGANSNITMNGTATATHGAVDIRHQGLAGQISMTGANINADIIKVAALGDNGVLTIGLNTTLSANTVLKLYATGSNGQIIFAGNCTIGGGNLNIIAAPIVTVAAGVDVTVTGAQAQIFTNQGNYSIVNGGNGAGGTFIGAGATTVPGGFGGQPGIGPPGGP
jgi:mannose-6-phosphate isomerase-like protein (cupin superfamily)